jgi:hypothetical protein
MDYCGLLDKNISPFVHDLLKVIPFIDFSLLFMGDLHSENVRVVGRKLFLTMLMLLALPNGINGGILSVLMCIDYFI